MPLDLAHSLADVNAEHGENPEALVRWACGLGKRAVTTTNFGPYEAVILHLVTREEPDMPIVWMDSGYGTDATYQFAEDVTKRLKLNLHVYVPTRTRAHRDVVNGGIPTPDDPRHAEFTREVKLEPFERAMREQAPEVWFTAIRKEQTAFRAGLSPVSISKDGVLKVAPVFHWSSKQMDDYLKAHGLPNNFDYFDPTKVEDKRECGLHTAH